MLSPHNNAKASSNISSKGCFLNSCCCFVVVVFGSGCWSSSLTSTADDCDDTESSNDTCLSRWQQSATFWDGGEFASESTLLKLQNYAIFVAYARAKFDQKNTSNIYFLS